LCQHRRFQPSSLGCVKPASTTELEATVGALGVAATAGAAVASPPPSSAAVLAAVTSILAIMWHSPFEVGGRRYSRMGWM
jgi:hypothetical protein